MSNISQNQFVKYCSNCLIPINNAYYLLCCHCGCKATTRICILCLKEHLERFPSKKPLPNQLMYIRKNVKSY